MRVKAGIPLCLNETGKRARQEDTIMPTEDGIAENGHLFVLCDGMGGHQHGDMASRIVADSIYSSLNQDNNKINADIVSNVIEKAYDALDSFSILDNTYMKMGTTMVCLDIFNDGYIAAHIGDSRIYHIRPNLYDEDTPTDCILYQSFDHSLVNMLIKMGEITEEEALHHPERHILLKAMQPGLGENRFRPYIRESKDIMPGDYYFLCSDGVSDYIDNATIARIISSKNADDTEKIRMIERLCHEKSNDNYSCWLIPIVAESINEK